MNTVAKKYPNRKKRKEVLMEYHKTVPYKERNALYSPGKVLFLTDAAEYLGVAKGTIIYWEKKGYLRPRFLRFAGGRYRVYQVDMLEQIKEVRNAAIREKQEANSN